MAKLDDLTLFVECKDYSEIKVDEKILFTLIGQVHDYRRDHPDDTVVGILVTSAKNAGQNLGIQNKLLREGCQLWDGNTIQKMRDAMINVDRRSEFTTYLFEKVGYIASADSTKSHRSILPGQHMFYCRMSFFSIPAISYIGNKFSHESIVMDLKNILEGSGIEISAVSYKNLDSNNQERINLIVDFEKNSNESDLKKHWKGKSKWFKKPKETPIELMEINFESACKAAIEQTYGVETESLTGPYPIHCIATRSQ